MKRMFSVAALFAIGASVSVHAQTQAQQDRLDRVARLLTIAPMCKRLGMTVDPDLPDKLEAALKEETASWKVDPGTIEQLAIEAAQRQSNALQIDLDAAAQDAKTSEQLRGVRNIILGYGRTCMEATTDTLFSRFIQTPAGYDLEKAVTAESDGLLENGGLASWQTPVIQAKGDMMMIAGACRSKLGAATSDALRREYGTSDDPRVRNYYSKAFDEGLSDTELDFTLAQCNRAIANIRNKVGARSK